MTKFLPLLPVPIKRLLRPVWRWQLNRQALAKWKRQGSPIPPPNIVKQIAVRDTARRYGIHHMIESGTYQGEMVLACLKTFDSIITIELNAALYERASKLLAGEQRVTTLPGNSADLLPVLLGKLTNPCLFWLDGHYSGEGTSKVGDLDGDPDTYTPICEELRAIFAHPIKDHVILIDDARGFVGQYGYPEVEELRHFCSELGSNYLMSVTNDTIFLLPRAA